MNHVILTGNVGKEPAIKTFENGTKAASFTLATTERGFTTKEGREIPDRTEWHNISVIGGLAKVVEGYVQKGTRLLVEGKIQTRTYEKNGETKYLKEIKASNIEMQGKASSESKQPQQPETSNNEFHADNAGGQDDEDFPF